VNSVTNYVDESNFFRCRSGEHLIADDVEPELNAWGSARSVIVAFTSAISVTSCEPF
jgi:hypothetical protein